MKHRKKIHDDWETPDYLLIKLRREFGVMYDPCPINPTFNGLDTNWHIVNFVNPPYNRKDKEEFIRKARNEQLKGNTSILLIPVSTSTKIFHEVILPNAEVRFLKGRIKFKGYNTNGDYVTDKCGQHDSMLCIFRGESKFENENNN